MERKIQRYFQACVRLIWIVDPATRTAQALEGPDDVMPIDEHCALDGGEVLPGFRLSLADLFRTADDQDPNG
jgi:Uma2 family endonuclease